MEQNSTQMAEHRTELSTRRTKLAAERTLLATKRTMLAWCRSALGIMAFAIALDKFALSSSSETQAAGLLSLIAFAGVSALLGFETVRFLKTVKQLAPEAKTFPSEALAALTVLGVTGVFIVLDAMLL